MQELIKIHIKDGQQLVSARELHKALKIKKRFSVWVKQNFKLFEEGTDFTSALLSTPYNKAYHEAGSQKLQDYDLTLDMAKQLCMISRTEKGKQYRNYLIKIERQMRDPNEIIKRGYDILQGKTEIDVQELSPELQGFRQILDKQIAKELQE